MGSVPPAGKELPGIGQAADSSSTVKLPSQLTWEKRASLTVVDKRQKEKQEDKNIKCNSH